MEFLTNKKIDTAQVLSILKQDIEKHIVFIEKHLNK